MVNDDSRASIADSRGYGIGWLGAGPFYRRRELQAPTGPCMVYWNSCRKRNETDEPWDGLLHVYRDSVLSFRFHWAFKIKDEGIISYDLAFRLSSQVTHIRARLLAQVCSRS
jgi:hypothetical protein